MFEYLSYLGLKSEEHKRHYISEIASLVIELPSKEKQNRIANLMTSLDNKLCEFEIKSKNSKLSVIDKIHVNGGLLFKKTVCRDSRQGVGYKVIE